MHCLRITALSLFAVAAPALGPAAALASSPCADGHDALYPFLPNVTCRAQPTVSVAYNYYGSRSRNVFWAPGAGAGPRPAVVLFQGTSSIGSDSLGLDPSGGSLGPGGTWNHAIDTAAPFGAYYQVKVVQALLDRGFTVIQPAAHYQVGIGYFWDTNAGWSGSEDQQFTPALIAAIQGGAFGPVDLTHLYATGISSGGYMTSRMANDFASRPSQLDPARPFRAVAIESASYESCSGSLCVIPTPLPAAHPPTLFLHGLLDSVVPIATAQAYDSALKAQAIPERFVVDPAAGHQWIAAAPGEIVAWFQGH